MKPPFPALGAIIDLDGTLLDTVADLAAGINAMLDEFGRDELSIERVAAYVGKGTEVLVHRALTGRLDGRAEPALAEKGVEVFYRHYARENGRQARVYPGVREGLAAMRERGLRLACVTNKPQVFSDALLQRTGLADSFEIVVGGDALPRRKPDPLPMLHACDRLGIAPRQMLAIGDSVNDAAAARAAGIPVLVVPYGYNEGRPAESIDADGIVSSLAEVSDWLAEPDAQRDS
ncbi:MAG: phosphoglycolate phosphatase [Limnobacter sp.]|nr:phosphoglycolate phosphatase [Limnobacter sp.]